MKELTVIYNGEDYEDQDISAIAFISYDQLVEYAKQYIKETFEFVIMFDRKYQTVFEWVKYGVGIDKFIEDNYDKYVKYYREKLSKHMFYTPTEEQINNAALDIGNPDEFIKYLISKDVEVITDFPVYNY